MEQPQSEGDVIIEEGIYEAVDEGMIGEMGEEIEYENSEKSDSHTGLSAADKKRHRIEYLQFIKEIENQNKIVDQLKEQIMRSCESSCLTKCELREIKKLRACLENENLKLQCMVQKAIQMQNENPTRFWEEIPIVTTIEEDMFPRIGNFDVMASFGLMAQKPVQERKEVGKCKQCTKSLKKQRRPCHTEDDLDSATFRLFEQLSLKDKMVECLNKKLQLLRQDLDSHSGQKVARSRRTDRPCAFGANLEDKIANMQCAMSMLKADIKSLGENKTQKSQIQDCEQVQKKPNDLQKLKEDYAHLLINFAKKDNQMKELEDRVKGYCGGSSKLRSENVDEVELKMLREKVNDLRDEHDEYTCIIKEQSEQIDEYRRKYLDAQQKVEEQKSMLEKIDMNNKRIEGQIEAEVKRIKAKFKEQLSELSQYPKLLENEQIKLATACKDREELEGKLTLVCKELKSVREKKTTDAKPDCSQKLAKCEQELFLLQNKTEELHREKDIVCEELLKAKQDLDTMRTESAKIITSTKERFELSKISMCSRIDILEKELAQCRANACMSINDREAVIKEMQSQLNTLSYSFDSAQKQIKTLKNHITFLSNDHCIPIKF